MHDREGRAYGDPDLIRLAAADEHVRDGEPTPTRSDTGLLVLISRLSGILGLFGAILVIFPAKFNLPLPDDCRFVTSRH